MTIRNIRGILPTALLSQFICACILSAQQPILSIREIQTSGLPVVRMKSAITRGGIIHPRQGRFSYTLLENGLPVPLEVDCPEAAYNSIMLVIDNSSSITLSLPSIGAAAKLLVDSMRAPDEAAVISFGSNVTLLQNFTGNKFLLKSSLDSMKGTGSTALYAASLDGVLLTAQRSGNRSCIILTDGLDNSSGGITADSVILAARQSNTTLFTIGFGTSDVSEKILARMADETGGRYFRTFSENDLAAIFRVIASDILSPYCTLSYVTSACRDSTRALHLEARLGAEQAFADTFIVVPSRPDTLRLTVDARPETAPGANTIVYIRLEPGVHTELPLSFRFLLRYDPRFFTVNPPIPVTLGTITQNALVNLRILRPGTLEFSAERIIPAFSSGNLTGVRFTGNIADSSRPVILGIDSVTLAAGCDNEVMTTSDTIDFCACRGKVAARLDSMKLVPAGQDAMEVAVYASGTMPDRALMFISEAEYDPSRLTPVDASIPAAKQAAEWIVDSSTPGRMSIFGTRPFLPDPALPLYVVRFRVERGRESIVSPIAVGLLKAYSDCCYRLDNAAVSGLLLEGACERIAVKKGGAALHSASPNPTRSTTLIAFDLPADSTEKETRISLAIYDRLARKVGLIAEASLPPGKYLYTFDAGALSAGVYRILLVAGKFLLSRPLLVIR